MSAGAPQAVALITGAGTGIGYALSMVLLAENVHVFAVGRRADPLNELQKNAPNASRVTQIAADVSKEEDRDKILQAVQKEGMKLDYLVHNAGVLGPSKALMDLKVEEFRQTMAINVEGPLFLTQKLVSVLKDGSRVLHVSSGAAHKAFPGWGCYCPSKAALYSIYNVLQAEQTSNVATTAHVPKFIVGSVRPGIVNTPMQAEIRASDESVFTPKKNFEEMYEKSKERDFSKPAPPPSDALDDPHNAGRFLSFLLRETSDEEYPIEEWDIRDPKHHHRWIIN